ncbi:hypothetical protein KDK_79170 [Dictyobacter kobayashii]|uniref:Cytochrome P450 n=1 Tax=Dictyobacter kobayashii TaxID=2014872 RepID=A0A402AYH1_9CHLR|nr:cytochrome P450 [Dictyobacter kobayashii]GCE24117.1 hypothetical protein KDK_79170 [Dictyobacter kobayashii]
MNKAELVTTAVLLLVAGHETTVNLITNSVLTLLRNPEAFDLLRHKPEILSNLIEEVLRYEPPVQFTLRTPLTDVTLGVSESPKHQSSSS